MNPACSDAGSTANETCKRKRIADEYGDTTLEARYHGANATAAAEAGAGPGAAEGRV